LIAGSPQSTCFDCPFPSLQPPDEGLSGAAQF